MENGFSLECPHCRHNSKFFVKQIRISWSNRCINHPRPYGDEISHHGTASVNCPKCRKTIDLTFYVIEYTKGVALKQEVYHDGKLISNETELGLLAQTYKPKPVLYGTQFPNRDNLDYFIVDKASEYYATVLLNDIVFLFGITATSIKFPSTPLPKWPGQKNKYLPAAVCSCMNKTTRKLSMNISKPCPKFLVSPIKKELAKLGYPKNAKSRKSYCTNPLGNCAEVNAANCLLRKGTTGLDNILFGLAIRPRTMEIILPCSNCSSIFPTL